MERFDTKAQLAYDFIKTSIIEGSYLAGEKVGISQVAKNLQTSDIPVREAMNRLESEGLLEYIPHVGFKVTPPEFEKYTEVYEVRQLLEGEAARRAAQAITPQEIEELIRLNDEIKAVYQKDNYAPIALLNYRFHALLYASSGNSILARQIEHVSAIYPRTRSIFVIVPERAITTIKEHEEIIYHLKNRDPDGSRKALLAHMAHGYGMLLKYKGSLLEKTG